jgi:hypothetical protein
MKKVDVDAIIKENFILMQEIKENREKFLIVDGNSKRRK